MNYEIGIQKNSLLKVMIARAALLGLGEEDVGHAQEFLRYNEFGLCFEHIITQLYEYDCKIDQEFYDLIARSVVE